MFGRNENRVLKKRKHNRDRLGLKKKQKKKKKKKRSRRSRKRGQKEGERQQLPGILVARGRARILIKGRGGQISNRC